ncbi:MAG: hypothetical protein ACTSX9_01355 [Candidatus Njordarchaeales archaeon]
MAATFRSIDELLDVLKDLRVLNCDKKGYDYPCVLCLECERAGYREYKFPGPPEILLKKTVNSAILSVKIPARDELDRLLIREVAKAITRRFPLILDKPEEGYDISLLIKATDVASKRVHESMRVFLIEFIGKIMEALTEARSIIRGWAEKLAARIQI